MFNLTGQVINHHVIRETCVRQFSFYYHMGFFCRRLNKITASRSVILYPVLHVQLAQPCAKRMGTPTDRHQPGSWSWTGMMLFCSTVMANLAKPRVVCLYRSAGGQLHAISGQLSGPPHWTSGLVYQMARGCSLFICTMAWNLKQGCPDCCLPVLMRLEYLTR